MSRQEIVEERTADEEAAASEAPRTVLSREVIFGAVDVKTEWINIPEWGGGVFVRGLTGAERDAYDQSCITGKGKNRDLNMLNARAKLAAMCCVDEAGKRIFQPGDVKRLGEKNAAVLDRIYDVAARLSGLSDEDLAELSGNSKPGQNGDSPSDWPGILG